MPSVHAARGKHNMPEIIKHSLEDLWRRHNPWMQTWYSVTEMVQFVFTHKLNTATESFKGRAVTYTELTLRPVLSANFLLCIPAKNVKIG